MPEKVREKCGSRECIGVANRLTTMKTNYSEFTVRSSNFSWHEPVGASTYAEAIAIAKARGWEAQISCGDRLVATWSPLYGVKVYTRELAQ